MLEGVGDENLGQWIEVGPNAVHVRRRVTDSEWNNRPWGQDLRGTDEAVSRLRSVRHLLPEGWSE